MRREDSSQKNIQTVQRKSKCNVHEIRDMPILHFFSPRGRQRQVRDFKFQATGADAVPSHGTLLVNGSLLTTPLTELTPAPMPRLVLINYQQRPYPDAIGRKQDSEGKKKNVATASTSTNAAAKAITAIYCSS